MDVVVDLTDTVALATGEGSGGERLMLCFRVSTDLVWVRWSLRFVQHPAFSLLYFFVLSKTLNMAPTGRPFPPSVLCSNH